MRGYCLFTLRRELPALRRVAQVFKAACPDKPLIVMPKGAHHSLEALSVIAEIDVLGLDWTTSPQAVRGPKVTPALRHKVVQGNLDPAFLMAPTEEVNAAVIAMLNGLTHDGNGSSLSGYIANGRQCKYKCKLQPPSALFDIRVCTLQLVMGS